MKKENNENQDNFRKEKELQLIEKIGISMEKSGLQPAAARVSSLLLISDEIELTFDEIREKLNLSKSATSTALNLLLNLNRIEYITKNGDRKRYFKSNISQWKSNILDAFCEVNSTSLIIKEILDHRSDKYPEFNNVLEELASLMNYIANQLPILYQQWEETQKNKQS